MEHYSVHLLFFTTLFFLLVSDFVALDTISPNQAIQDGETIVSQGEMYELGFFSPGNTKRRYVGIWYKKISKGTVVWVANRETPIHDTSGMFKLCGDGNLVILGGDNTVIWSSYSTVSVSVGSNDFVAQLLDSGNLVVRDKSRTRTDQNVLWESFDYPGDTLLPGMKFGKDLVTGLERFMSSWKSPDDPSCGVYNHILDTSGYPQIFGRRGSVLLSRLGPWTGVRFSGFATEIPNPIFSAEFVLNEKEIYHKYELVSSVVERRILTWDGKIIILRWIDRKQDWVVYADTGGDTTCSFELCGPYGVCSINKHPPCSCMQGFEPKFPQEWEASDWSNGCHHKKRSDSGNQYGFQKISGIKLPDTRFSWYNHNMTLGECEMMCRRNFSCTAYSNLDTRNGGSGCLLWFKELMDAREYDTEDHNIYIRMVASELAVERHQSNSIRWKGVLTAVLSISSAGLVMFSVAYACRKREKRLQMKKKEDLEYALGKKNSSEQTQLLDDTPFIPLYKVAKATNDFSVSNKIGEGGFGPVYKGVLEDGQEVAVKRLSDTSQQGIDEFRNELASIAKLQHRNLVKLLGYCINGNEMVLIYEYMANKSLDSFIFDETRSSMLVWPQRFQIILGMARGILYLHQDSRFQIVHRDLKAGNILLDGDMNPKISDFGLARMFVGHDTTAKTKKVVGTYGYISPEYAVHGRFSIKSDVFSFGVLVLEIISGKKNREFSHEDHNDNLLGHAWRLYKDNNSIQLMSACLRASCVVPEVLRSIHVGLLCVQNHAKDRPTMLSVLLMLLIEGVLPEPKQPAFFTEENREINYVSPLDEEMITRLHPR